MAKQSKAQRTHTPAPWKADRWRVLDAGLGGHLIADCGANVPRDPEVQYANARLIAAAPAMKLALEMIACGAARLERSGPLVEFCFDGLRYSLSDDWNDVIGFIGWDKCREAVTKATAS